MQEKKVPKKKKSRKIKKRVKKGDHPANLGQGIGKKPRKNPKRYLQHTLLNSLTIKNPPPQNVFFKGMKYWP